MSRQLKMLDFITDMKIQATNLVFIWKMICLSAVPFIFHFPANLMKKAKQKSINPQTTTHGLLISMFTSIFPQICRIRLYVGDQPVGIPP